MKRIITFLIAFAFLCKVGSVWGQTTSVMMPYGDDYDNPKTVTVTDPITFYDSGGSSSNAESWCDYPSSVCFVPGKEGEVIEISFETVDVKSAQFKIYDGFVDVGYDDLPDGDKGVIAAGSVFTSASSDGKMTVGYYCSGASGTGWKAVVKSVSLKDMIIGECIALSTGVSSVPVGSECQPVMLINVKAEGSLNPLTVSELSFSLSGTVSVSDLQNLKVYYSGNKLQFNDAHLYASESSGSSDIKVSGSQELASGNNYFWLVGDVTAASVVGNKIAAQCTSIKVAGNEVLETPIASVGEVYIGNELSMSAMWQNCHVGRTSLNFYDDGGPDGKISEGFKGQTTFIPSTSGRRIQIEFKKVALFSTTTSDKSDILKVYNGKSVNEADLNIQISSGDIITVTSSSDDGALTVALTSVTGALFGEGFEAVVSEVEPREMTVKSIVAAQYTDGTIMAGDVLQPILSLNIQTENVLPIIAQTFKFTTSGTTNPADVTKASVYYTGKKAEFGSSNKIGEVILNGSSDFEITGCTQELGEGNNYFWLAYDIDPRAVAGNKIDAGCTAVVLSGKEEIIADTDPEGDRTIKNEYVSTVGTFEKTIYGSWTYTHTPKKYGSGYEAVQGNQIVTFIPYSEGKIIELEYQDFAVSASSGPYGVDATYIIYSGKGTTGEVLWKANTADKRKNGPETIIRSKSEDGAVTVLFNANDSFYNADGWHAFVREYQSKDMSFDGIDVVQASSDFVAGGTADQEILRFKIVTGGDKTPLSLNKIAVDLKNSQSCIDKVSVYYTGKNDAFATTNKIGSIDVDGSVGNLEIPVSSDFILEEGDTYFWITYDVKAGAAPSQKLDAKLLSVTINNILQSVENGDPEGDREIKNVCLLPVSGHETINVGDFPYVCYDDGGADGEYSETQEGALTFVPKPGDVIKLTFKQFKTSVRDYLEIYDGTGVEDENLSVKYDGDLNESLPESIISKAEDGSLTIRFNRTGYIVNDGWEIEVSSYTLKPLSCGTVKATSVNEKSELLGGSLNEKMLKVAVEAIGDRGSFVVDELSFGVTNSESLMNTKVYFTGTSDVFSPESQFGTEQTGDTPVFTGEQSISAPGTYYFWLTCDIRSDAAIGTALSFVQSGIKVNGNPFAIESSETANLKIKDGFHGTHTIGENGEYKTITAAVEAMKDGINGAVVFELENGIYNEEVIIPEIPGASAANTITLKSKSGNYSDVTITAENHSGGYDEQNSAVMTIFGADYLTVEGITFTNPDNTYYYLMDVKNASNYVTIRNCYFKGEVMTSEPVTSDPHKLLHTNFVNQAVENTPDTYMTVEGNLFEGGYIAVQAGGANPTDTNKGTKIIGNTFKNQWSKAIYLNYDVDGVIEKNVISSNCSSKKEYNGIDMNTCYNTVVRNNVISATMPYICGIKLRPVAGSEEKHFRVYNNVLNLKSLTSSDNAYAISITGGSTTNKISFVDIVNNTIRLSGNNVAKCAGIYNISNFSESITVQNNIIQNEAGGYVYWINSKPLKATTLNNNALYTSGTVFAKNYTTIENWLTASKESNSINQKVTFQSDEILALKTLDGLNAGIPLDFVATDIVGNVRDTEHPTIGAYEFVVAELPAMESGYPILSGDVTYNSAVVTVKVTANAEVYYLLKNDEKEPSVEDVIAADNKVSVSKGQETAIPLTELKQHTEYYAFFVLKGLADGQLSEVIAMSAFTTAYAPTSVSTFEDVTVMETGFEDGTARFNGFVVEEITDGIEDSRKAAKLQTEGTVTLINTSDGLILTGFYLKSDADVTISASKDQLEISSRTIASTQDRWIYYSLKEWGEITSITLSSKGNVYIDNFSGKPQKLMVTSDDKTVSEGESVILTADVSGGVSPYTYSWRNSKNEILSTEEQYSFVPQECGDYTLTVTDAWDEAATITVRVIVTGEAATATFENLYLDSESYWMGDPEESMSSFVSGSYKFSNYYEPDYATWAYFGYSNVTSTVYNPADFPSNQFGAAAGSGVHESENYAVAYASSYFGPTQVEVLNNPEGDVVKGCYVTNTAWVKYVTEQGTGMNSSGKEDANLPFTIGDYYKIIATGDNGKTVEFYLVDYRNSAERIVVDTWEWFDLTSLGKVKKITFTVDGSRKNDWGTTIPTYFCLDDFNGTESIPEGLSNSDTDNCKVYLSGDMLRFEQCSGYTFSIYNINGTLSDKFNIDDDYQTIRLKKEKGLYIVVGTNGKNTITRKIQLR
ncbi:MAG: DUF4465 domain-containing protein [Tannerella sp.]|uniref:DUF4465 domain-containing protein n=1 Tax=Coprobacter fastidiosus TaxID=1099853 RepID=UPI0026364182|nr:DUF4465 domain-containing protein [Coprobacter fastidiosus]MBS6268639.1 DUF4465 domain-containing protein [Tannerella sp.]